MAVKVVMPKLGLTMTEGVLTRWLVQNGTGVKKGQPIFEVETDKVVNEAQADADGVLRIVVDAGASVPVMGLVGYILAPGEEMPEAGLSVAPTPEAVVPAEGAEEKAATTGVEGQAARPMASPAAKRRAKELEVDITQVAGTGEGGRITLADVEALAAPGQSAVEAPVAEEDRAPAKEVRASPLAKRMARQAGLDLSAVQGTGAGGRITKEDVERALAEREQGVVGAGLPQRGPAGVPAPGAGTRLAPTEGELIPLSGVRAVIAERMLASSQETAAVTITSSVDATELVNLRDRLNRELADELGFRFAYYDILIKALAVALRECPYMNAHREEGAVRLLPDVHIGLAVDTERGLLVVVVRDADQKSIPDISRETRDKAERAVAGTITPEELSGGTFTLTNLGAFGVEAFTPIINPPEVAVLGVGRIEPAPMAYQGQIALRQRMVLSLTFDHRLIDGAPAARFLARIRELVEQPDVWGGSRE
jgi:pyruvate/2-oxoglutarate dehydrogenase complex dihydrolipoamide acyltransferase (E2) component